MLTKDSSLGDLLLYSLELKKGYRASTLNAYKIRYSHIARYPIINEPFTKITKSEAKIFMITLATDDSRKKPCCRYVRQMYNMIYSAYELAIDDELINSNPFAFQIKRYIGNSTPTNKLPLSQNQQKRILGICENKAKKNERNKLMYFIVCIFLQTGLRVAELCGLTVDDVDFQNGILKVNKQLTGDPYNGKIAIPKSAAGNRKIPLTENTCEIFRWIIESNGWFTDAIEVQGVSRFIFISKTHLRPICRSDIARYLQSVKDVYNEIYNDEPITRLTPHTLRHTFCTNMVYAGVTPKTLQYVMGHANIDMTLSYYAHVDKNKSLEEVKQILNKLS